MPEAKTEGRSRAFWSGTISFGLVTIPVELYSATHESRRSLRMIAPSGAPVSRRYFTEDGKPLEGDDIARGYEYDDDYVVVSDDELESLAPEQSRDIELSRFVERDAISPLFFDHAYIMAPAGNSNAAYRLLASTLEKNGKAGIARFVMRGKQHPVAIFGQGGLLRAYTMHFAEELRDPRKVGLPKLGTVKPAKLSAMKALIGKHKLRGRPEQKTLDSYEHKLEQLVARKQKSKKNVVRVAEDEQAAPMADVIDLVAILKKSLGQGAAAEGATATKKKAAKKKAPAKRATRRAAHGR